MNLVDGALRICTASGRVFWGAATKRTLLKAKEYGVLRILMENAGQVVTRRRILELLYGWPEPPDDAEGIVDVFVDRLCGKFTAWSGTPLPISRRGAGYIYEPSRLPNDHVENV